MLIILAREKSPRCGGTGQGARRKKAVFARNFIDIYILFYYIEAMEDIERNILSKLERQFGELRDELLAASQEFARSENHDWNEAERLFNASKRVDELCRSALAPSAQHPIDKVTLSRESNGDGSADQADRRPRKKSKKDYPQYTVRSGALVKIGLSRNRRDVYEHTVPRTEFDAVIERLGQLVGRKHFSADDVIDKVSCPSYQAYIVISLLKDRGLLAVPRRGMYAFTRPKNFLGEAGALWDSLEQRQTENGQ